MGTEKLAATELRNTLYRLRESQGWSMAAMADILRGKGLKVYPTTIAKIEAGDRTVKVDELVAYAEVFEVSVDTLLGHSTQGAGDKLVQVSALADLGMASLWQLQATEARLRRAVAAVDGFKLTKHENILRTGCANACNAMTDAIVALDDTTAARDTIYEKNTK
jgi:transcriptional regulator with XRE-family HTH domain